MLALKLLGVDDAGSAVCGQGSGETGGGHGTLPASGPCFNVPLTAHEFGHAFGLSARFSQRCLRYVLRRDTAMNCRRATPNG